MPPIFKPGFFSIHYEVGADFIDVLELRDENGAPIDLTPYVSFDSDVAVARGESKLFSNTVVVNGDPTDGDLLIRGARADLEVLQDVVHDAGGVTDIFGNRTSPGDRDKLGNGVWTRLRRVTALA